MGNKILIENDAATDGRLRVPSASQQVAQGIALEKEKQKVAANAAQHINPTAATNTASKTISTADHDIAHAATNIGTGAGHAIGAGTSLLSKGVSSLAKAASDNPLAAATLAGGAGLAYALKRRKQGL